MHVRAVALHGHTPALHAGTWFLFCPSASPFPHPHHRHNFRHKKNIHQEPSTISGTVTLSSKTLHASFRTIARWCSAIVLEVVPTPPPSPTLPTRISRATHFSMSIERMFVMHSFPPPHLTIDECIGANCVVAGLLLADLSMYACMHLHIWSAQRRRGRALLCR